MVFIIFLVISQGLFFKRTGINVFHPMLYQYVYKDTVNVITVDGFIFKFVWNYNGGRTNYRLVDSLYTGLTDLNFAKFDGDDLWLSNSSAGYLLKTSNPVKIIDAQIIDVGKISDMTLILTKNHTWSFKENSRFKRLDLTGTYFAPINDTIGLIVGNGRVWLTNGANYSLIYSNSKFRVRKWYKDLQNNAPFIKTKVWEKGRKGILLYFGSPEGEKISRILYLTYSGQRFDTLDYPGYLTQVEYSKGRFWVFLTYKNKTLLRVIDEKTLEVVDSFRYLPFPTEVLKLNDGYWFIFVWGGPTYLFKNVNKSYNYWPWTYRVFSNASLVDFDNDGDKDIVILGTSIWSAPLEKKNWRVVFLENQISEYKDKAFIYYENAKKHSNIFKCNKGLLEIDLALEILNVLEPDSLHSLFEWRDKILRNLKLRNRLIKISRILFKLFLTIIIPVGIVLIFYLRYREEKEKTKTVPSSSTIVLLLSLDIFHKYPSKWHPIVENPRIIREKFEEILKDVSENLQILNTVKSEFIDAPREWRKFFNDLFMTLFRIKIILKICRRIRIFQNVCYKVLQGNVRKIGRLRDKFKDLSQSAKVDIISGALLPAVEKIQKEISHTPIKISTDIKTELPYFYYPDEIAKLKSAFYNILSNAVEAFDNFVPQSDPEIKIKVRSTVSELTIEIVDNGKGIPKEIMPQIFEDGFSYGKSGKDQRGTGLFFARNVIEKYGSIEIHSEVGKGTKVIIKLIFGKREGHHDIYT